MTKNDIRSKKLKLNIVSSLLRQAVALVCGFIIPGLMIKAYGSEAYGATASIAQFLGYITLLEAGIGGVARAALYKPLNSGNSFEISCVVNEIKRFFKIIGCFFSAYVAVLFFSFYYIGKVECFDWLTTGWLVLVISISTFAEYFVGISYNVLLLAAQKNYVTQFLSIFTTVLNAVSVVLLINAGVDIIWVKLVSSCVFLIKPIYSWIYVKKHYNLIKETPKDKTYLEQKWTGLGQHFAFFLHNNTDIAVLTVFLDLKYVAVYSVYNMVIAQIQNIATSFSNGQEALFGDLIAGNEKTELRRRFRTQETLISLTSVFLFSVTAVLIVPFVRVYTKNVTDANYINYSFALLFALSGLIYSLRGPYHSTVMAAGHFKQTKIAAYGEAVINIALSCILVNRFTLTGVAIGTLAATMFRYVYYVVYLSRRVLEQSVLSSIKRFIINVVTFAVVVFVCNLITKAIAVRDYVQWLVLAIIVSAVSAVIILLINIVCYKKDVLSFIKRSSKCQ